MQFDWKLTGIILVVLAIGSCMEGQTNTFPSSGNVGIGSANPTLGTLQIAAPDQSAESAIAIRQSNSSGYGFDFAVDQNVNGMGYLFGIAGNNRTILEQFDRINNFVGVGIAAPQARFQVSDAAKVFSTVNNEFDSNMEIQGTYSGKAIGQGPSLGFIAPANADGTNPWEMARILTSPDTTGSSDARGRMYLQTRTNNGTGWIWNNNLVLNSTGSVGIGTTNPGAELEVNGNVKLTSGSGASLTYADGTTQSTAWTGVLCGGDYAEAMNVAGSKARYQPGDVLVLASDDSDDVQKSAEPYSTMVAGIYATKPGVIGRRAALAKSTNDIPMAMVGVVPTKVSAENGPIHRGDLLVSSSTPGYAMKGTDRSRLVGAVIGKAMGMLNSGTGTIEVLVTLQ